MRKKLGKYIVADSKICHGQLTFRGTRIFVRDILEQVAQGMAWDDIRHEWHDSISNDAIAEAVRLAGKVLREQIDQPALKLNGQ